MKTMVVYLANNFTILSMILLSLAVVPGARVPLGISSDIACVWVLQTTNSAAGVINMNWNIVQTVGN